MFISYFLTIILILECVESFVPNHPVRFFLEHHSSIFLNANDWLESKEVRNNEIKIKLSRDSICRSTVSIQKNEVFFSLPQGLCLDSGGARRKFSSLFTSSMLKTGDIGMLALFLLFEKVSTGSKFEVYISSLPPSAVGILGWSQADIDELIQSTTRDIRSQLSAIDSDISAILACASLNSFIPAQFLTRETLLWAIGTVKSRAVYIGGSPTLVPGKYTQRHSSVDAVLTVFTVLIVLYDPVRNGLYSF
jgi:hypothetical protein